ncbi:zinc-binding alcohol dehydrogenase family protein [Enterococcus mundtii]|uniref:NADPH:quinone reductase n=1 Tax=Enterococcus mundtii TaxID=53346 RepID=A0A2S7RZ99_ENTMU|nr:zinc-binding alcohol dehydrogenase family protein [Enterococcus mundtii]PQF25516.1 NADPH:quinone reductase [Enterococcus mundtii]
MANVPLTMKRFGFTRETPYPQLIEEDTVTPEPEEHDLLIEVVALSINPVDIKRREIVKEETFTVLGYDSVGYVRKMGSAVTDFHLNDRVYYAGTTQRGGSQQEYQLVDARIVAKAPENLSDEAAAAIPLTALTAYELLFEKFQLVPEEKANEGKELLVINGGGGVGSIMTQLAKWAGMTVYATASPQNFGWLEKNGVDLSLDYHHSLHDQLKQVGINGIDYVAVLYDIEPYLSEIKKIIQPLGHIGMIVNTKEKIDLNEFKNNSISFHWEYVFTKTDHDKEIETQGAILKTLTQLFEENKLHSHVTTVYSDGINQTSLEHAMKAVSEGKQQGKMVLSGGFKTSRPLDCQDD